MFEFYATLLRTLMTIKADPTNCSRDAMKMDTRQAHYTFKKNTQRSLSCTGKGWESCHLHLEMHLSYPCQIGAIQEIDTETGSEHKGDWVVSLERQEEMLSDCGSGLHLVSKKNRMKRPPGKATRHCQFSVELTTMTIHARVPLEKKQPDLGTPPYSNLTRTVQRNMASAPPSTKDAVEEVVS